MTDCMMFPDEWAKFMEDYSFADSEEVYTNGTELIPTFRVEQMMEHYLRKAVADKWIPVTERMPKSEEAVLCFIKNGEQDILQFDYFENLWIGRQWTYKRHAVTHWMPLPEPPKEE